MIEISTTAATRLAAAHAAAKAALAGGDRRDAADHARHAAGEVHSYLIAVREELAILEERAAALLVSDEPTDDELRAILLIAL